MTPTAQKLRTRAAAVAAVAAALLAGACSGQPDTGQPQNAAMPAPAAPAPPPPPPPPAPQAVHANELGEVPVLMYHRITPQVQSVYDRSPQDFRAELERLAREDYVPVTATDYATGHIDIPAGKHPVVLTFDDSSTTQFALTPDGKPAPDTAVSILEQVAAEHPGFTPTATFYALNPPFDEAGGRTTLNWLHAHGFEIGDHTLDHPNLGKVSPEQAQHEIAGMQKLITDAVPGVQVRSLALPLGMHPDPKQLSQDGTADGTTYHMDSVMLVGSDPAPSPFSASFKPYAVPRIRSQGPAGKDAEYGSQAWLDKLAAQPDQRYTSDGDSTKISVPQSEKTAPSPAVAAKLTRY